MFGLVFFALVLAVIGGVALATIPLWAVLATRTPGPASARSGTW